MSGASGAESGHSLAPTLAADWMGVVRSQGRTFLSVAPVANPTISSAAPPLFLDVDKWSRRVWSGGNSVKMLVVCGGVVRCKSRGLLGSSGDVLSPVVTP